MELFLSAPGQVAAFRVMARQAALPTYGDARGIAKRGLVSTCLFRARHE